MNAITRRSLEDRLRLSSNEDAWEEIILARELAAKYRDECRKYYEHIPHNRPDGWLKYKAETTLPWETK